MKIHCLILPVLLTFAAVLPANAINESPRLITVVSRKNHVPNLVYDLNIPLSGSPAIEPRAPGSGGTFQLIATFSHTLNGVEVLLRGGTATLSGTPAISGTKVTVNVSNVNSAQTVDLLFTNVRATGTPQAGAGGVRLSFVPGDANGDRSVDAADVSFLTSKAGTPLSSTSFLWDVNLSGAIDAQDSTYAQSKTGTSAQAMTLTPQQSASRFLSQATFGPTTDTINEVVSLGIPAWIDRETTKPVSQITPLMANYNLTPLYHLHRPNALWEVMMQNSDQLRQRVTYALSQIFVVSDAHPNLYPISIATYHDLLAKNAFGNYRQLLKDITLSPTMGVYLSHLRNRKANPATGTRPDENFAREIMQLFSIGLYKLNQDGSVQLSGGVPIPTYDIDQITNFARVFTGLTYGTDDGSPPTSFTYNAINWFVPMYMWEEFHDTDAKTLLTYSGSVHNLPAGRTGLQDIDSAIDNLFYHPNVGPFLAYRLIQRLTVSNPTPAYISRVAAVFNNNGSGVRGDLKAVIKAILMDAEARDLKYFYDDDQGKLREPYLRVTQLARAFKAYTSSTKTQLKWESLYYMSDSLGQEPFRSPTVFNFYLPEFQPPGEIGAAGLVGPEFQILNAVYAPRTHNQMRRIADIAVSTSGAVVKLDLNDQIALAANPENLLNNIDLFLTAGTMSPASKAVVLNAISRIPSSDATNRAKVAIHLAATSPDYVVQK